MTLKNWKRIYQAGDTYMFHNKAQTRAVFVEGKSVKDFVMGRQLLSRRLPTKGQALRFAKTIMKKGE